MLIISTSCSRFHKRSQFTIYFCIFMFIFIYNVLVTLKHTHAIKYRHNLKIAASLRNTLTGSVHERSSYNKRRADRSATIFALFDSSYRCRFPVMGEIVPTTWTSLPISGIFVKILPIAQNMRFPQPSVKHMYINNNSLNETDYNDTNLI